MCEARNLVVEGIYDVHTLGLDGGRRTISGGRITITIMSHDTAAPPFRIVFIGATCDRTLRM
jgi:hypothetical protein